MIRVNEQLYLVNYVLEILIDYTVDIENLRVIDVIAAEDFVAEGVEYREGDVINVYGEDSLVRDEDIIICRTQLIEQLENGTATVEGAGTLEEAIEMLEVY